MAERDKAPMWLSQKLTCGMLAASLLCAGSGCGADEKALGARPFAAAQSLGPTRQDADADPARDAVSEVGERQPRPPPLRLTDAQVQALADALLPEVTQAIGLRALRPVQAVQIDKRQLRRLLEADSADDLAQELQVDRRSSPRPSKHHVRDEAWEAYLDELQENVLGLYDPRTKQLMLMQNIAAQERESTMRHELTHALQDQHFDLLKLQAQAAHSFDRGLALTAVLEGQAMAAMAVQGAETPQEPLALPPPAAGTLWAKRASKGQAGCAALLRAMGSALPRLARVEGNGLYGPQAKQLAITLFPYVQGARFIDTLARAWPLPEVVHTTLTRVPTSTRAILHPEAYFFDQKSLSLTLPTLENLPGKTLLMHDTLGEFATFLELGAEPAAAAIASGWRNDRFLRFAGFASPDVSIVVTSWRDAVAARRFCDKMVENGLLQGGRIEKGGALVLDNQRLDILQAGAHSVVVADVQAHEMPAVRRALLVDLLAMAPN